MNIESLMNDVNKLRDRGGQMPITKEIFITVISGMEFKGLLKNDNGVIKINVFMVRGNDNHRDGAAERSDFDSSASDYYLNGRE